MTFSLNYIESTKTKFHYQNGYSESNFFKTFQLISKLPLIKLLNAMLKAILSCMSVL